MLTFGFGCNLTSRRSEGGNALNEAKETIEGWALQKFDSLRAQARDFSSDEKTFTYQSSTVWQLDFKQKADFSGDWNTQIRVSEEKQCAENLFLTIAMSLDQPQAGMSPARFYVEPPRFMLQLNDVFTLSVGTSVATSEPMLVSSDRDADNLANEIRSDRRSLPIVLVSVKRDGDPIILGLEDHLSRRLFGLAQVALLKEEATSELAHQIGHEMSCFNGALRILWPGWKQADSKYRHPLFLPSRVEASALANSNRPESAITTSLLAPLARASTSRFALPQQLRSTIDGHRLKEIERDILDRTQGELAERLVRAEQLLAEQRGIMDVALSENSELIRENDALKDQAYNLQVHNDQLRLRRNASHVLGPDVAANADQDDDFDPWLIDDVNEAVARARHDFSATLIIPSSVQVQTSQKGGYWYHVLMCLNILCEKERKGEATDKRTQLRQLLTEYLGLSKDTYKVADTNVFVEHPVSNMKIEARERIHLKEGKPAETESIYWTTVGGKQLQYQYLIGRLGRHA